MPFPYDKYPWLNFQELNLAYFIRHFREIFQQWDQLYHDLTEWKDATDQELNDWREATMAGLNAWKEATSLSLDTQLSDWQDAITAGLDSWKAAFEAEYAALKSEVEGIRDQAALNQQAAEEAATQAQASAADAALAAADAAASLSTLVNTVSWKETEINLLSDVTFTEGYLVNQYGARSASTVYHYSAAIPVKPNSVLTFSGVNPGSGTSNTRIIAYETNAEPPDTGSGGPVPGLQIYHHGNVVETYSGEFYIPEGYNYIRVSIRVTEQKTMLRREGLKALFAVSGARPENVSPRRSYSGKYMSILGGSISTFQGWIPEGYSVYYPYNNVTRLYPVTTVEETYWYKVAAATGMQILVNNSSAGSFVSTHGGADMAGCGDRCTALHTAEHDPDVILVQLGGNDFTREVPILGTWQYSGPLSSYSGLNLGSLADAYAVMLDKMTRRYPKALICCGLVPVISGSAQILSPAPAFNEDRVSLYDYNECIRKTAAMFNCKVIDWQACGLTFYNAALYMQDYGQHPNKYGHSLMAQAVLECLGLPSDYVKEVF